MELARRRLAGLGPGIEIGRSVINTFPGIEAWNVDLQHDGYFQAAQREVASLASRVDVVAPASRLPFADGALGFVLTSHVIEHMNDAIRALHEWDRVVRPGGVIFTIAPHKERTSDVGRPRTPLRHLLADYAEAVTAESDFLIPTSHHHVWVTEDFVEIIAYLTHSGCIDWEVTDVEDVDSKVGNGFTVVARKRSTLPPPEPPPRPVVAFRRFRLILPFQAIGRIVEGFSDGPDSPPPSTLPGGVYQVSAITDGFPPRVAWTQRISVGATTQQPRILHVERSGQTVRMIGEHLTPSTYVEARLPDGIEVRLLPRFTENGLEGDFGRGIGDIGQVVMRAVNPSPSGGASLPFVAWL